FVSYGMMSFNSNIRSKINALNNNAKGNSVASKPNIKVSNSISEKIKKLSSSTEATPVIGSVKKSPRENEDKQLKDVKDQSSSIKTKEDAITPKVSSEPSEMISSDIQDTNQDESACETSFCDSNEDLNDIDLIKKKLTEYQYINKQLRIENNTLHEELHDIRNEMDELQDQFRLDDADEFRQLQAELEIAAKNCRILQFKLRKLEKRNESLETEKIILQDKLDEFSREANKIIDLEEELLIAKEVSIRLNGELEQAHEWKVGTEKLNNDLKKQLDQLKDYLDNEIKNREHTHDLNELVLVNQLYESMFREYFLQEQLYSISNNSQTQAVSSQLREVNDLMNSYQQKIALLNEEIDILKIQLVNKEKEMDQMKIQLRNLKRSRSSDSGYERGRQSMLNNSLLGNKATSNMSLDMTGSLAHSTEQEQSPGKMQVANDEIKLLKNKIARLEDDLVFTTQEKENLVKKMENIDNRATKFFLSENDAESELCKSLEKQIRELKKKIGIQ
ncbi:SOGA2, partial [Brachionus plicatilis]